MTNDEKIDLALSQTFEILDKISGEIKNLRDRLASSPIRFPIEMNMDGSNDFLCWGIDERTNAYKRWDLMLDVLAAAKRPVLELPAEDRVRVFRHLEKFKAVVAEKIQEYTVELKGKVENPDGH